MKANRVFMVVLDSCGIGYEPDAHLFGDVGANTLKRIAASREFSAKNLIKLGLSDIDGIDYLEKCDAPTAARARLREISNGKDTTIGHWELMGIISHHPLPTYPGGFPKDILEKFEAATGRGVLCNLPYSGTDVIRDYGEEHMNTGKLIVYTSADSVFQIAAHETIVPPELLYEYCTLARNILVGEHAVGRVIARPFVGVPGDFTRTANRRDFSIEPPKATAMDAIKEAGLEVIAVGKINDIFVGHGVTDVIHTHSNTEGMEITKGLLEKDFRGFVFTNLVDFDMKYGHRQDIDGYAAALAEFDAWLPSFTENMKAGDVLIITADHGCDPGDSHTDHTREYVPLIIYGDGIKPENLGTLDGFTAAGATAAELLGVSYTPDGGESVAKKISD